MMDNMRKNILLVLFVKLIVIVLLCIVAFVVAPILVSIVLFLIPIVLFFWIIRNVYKNVTSKHR